MRKTFFPNITFITIFKKVLLNINRIVLIIVLLATPLFAYSQVVLEADGPGNTYELISSKLAPGADAVEHPECIHPEFGRHIVEVWDIELNQFVFEFYIHVTPDNDRCINTDRQRIEIKTYESSPDNLKSVVGETVTYKWKFRLPVGFQSSSKFTHIHQIKAVGGNDGNPIFTLTPRKGSPNKMELIHDNTTKVATADLSLFEGIWVECTEIIYIHPTSGNYSISVKKVSDGTTILSYSNSNLMTIRSDNNFIRPKWGIYRSLDYPSDLRDESVRFAGFYLAESVGFNSPAAPSDLRATVISSRQINLDWIDNSTNENQFKIERSANGNRTWSLLTTVKADSTSYSDTGLSASSTYYYRVSAENSYGSSLPCIFIFATTSSPTEVGNENQIPTVYEITCYPNPFNPITIINYSLPKSCQVSLKVFDLRGKEIATLVDEFKEAGVYTLEFSPLNFSISSGIYFYSLQADEFVSTKKMILLK